MALRDTWHKTLLYFGLAGEREYDDDYYYDDEDAVGGGFDDAYEAPSARPATVSRLSERRRRDDIEEIFSDDEPPAPVGRGGRSLRPVGGGERRVHLVSPSSFNDAQEVADRFKNGVPVILNLQATDGELAKRLIDFGSGLTYALDGGMQKVAEKTFLLTPHNVEVSAEERARLVEKGFFNQS